MLSVMSSILVKSKSIVSEVKENAPSVEPNMDRILRTLSDQESFYFYKAVGRPIGEKAVSLVDFATKIKKSTRYPLLFTFTVETSKNG
jgi:hypothetical protein